MPKPALRSSRALLLARRSLSGAPFSSWLHGPGGARALSMRETARVILPVVSALGAAHTKLHRRCPIGARAMLPT